MKILYITPILPYPPNSGGSIITYNTIIKLAKKNKITIYTFIIKKDYSKYQAIFKKKGVESIVTSYNPYITDRIRRIHKFLLLIKCFFSSKPFTVFKYYSVSFKKNVHELVQKNKFACIWVDSLNMADYLPENFKGKKVLELQNIDSLFFKRMFFHDGNFLLKLFAMHEWLKYEIYERRHFFRFDKIATVSNVDKNVLLSRYKKLNVSVSYPKITFSKKIKRINTTDKILLFTGSLKWYPNRDGMLWFLEKVLPRVREICKDVKLWIVGEYLEIFDHFQDKNIKFFPERSNKSMNEFYSKAKLIIVPIRYGGGVRMKIIEALSYRLPIISTAFGAEGIDKKLSKYITIADSESTFANKIIDHLASTN